MKKAKNKLTIAAICCALTLFIGVAAALILPNANAYADEAETVTFSAIDGLANTTTPAESYGNLFDGKKTAEDGTKYCVDTHTGAPYVVVKASKPIVVSGYTFYTAGDTSDHPDRNPYRWNLYGRNNYDEENKSEESSDTAHWILLTEVEDNSLPDENYASKEFTVTNNTNAYAYYKIEFLDTIGTSTGGTSGYFLQLSEVELTYTVCAHSFGAEQAATASTCQTNGHKAYRQCSACNGYSYADGISAAFCASTEYDTYLKIPLSATHDTDYVAQKAATCTEDGATQSHFHCKDCGKNFSDYECTTEITGDLTIPATGHTCGDWTERVERGCVTDGNRKFRQCSVCKAYEYYDDDNVLQTCAEDDYFDYIEITAIGDHDWEWTHDDAQHWQVCTVCGDVKNNQKQDHYFHNCSTKCNHISCSYERSEEAVENLHTYEKDYDETNHWKICKNTVLMNSNYPNGKTCDRKIEITAHTYTQNKYVAKLENGTYYHYLQCDDCEYVDEATKTACTYNAYSHDDNYHWQACTVCGQINESNKVRHTYTTKMKNEDQHDGYCETCGSWLNNPGDHAYKTIFYNDAQEHWHYCNLCNSKYGRGEHVTETQYNSDEHWVQCSTCEKELSDKENHTYSADDLTQCLGCDYSRIYSVVIEYEGYQIDGPLKNFTASITVDGVEIAADKFTIKLYDKDSHYIDFSDEDSEDYGAFFVPNTQYFVEFELTEETEKDLTLLTGKNFTVNGALVYADGGDSDHNLTAYVILPVLGGTGENKQITQLTYSLGNFELGKKINELTLTANNGNVAGVELEDLSGEQETSSGTNSGYFFEINDESMITLSILLSAPEGYHFYGFEAEDFTIEGLGKATYCTVSPGGREINLSFNLTTLVKEHTCTYDSWSYTDDTGHFTSCTICGAQKSEPHKFDDSHDAICDDCRYTRVVFADKLGLTLTGYEVDKQVIALGATVTSDTVDVGIHNNTAIYGQTHFVVDPSVPTEYVNFNTLMAGYLVIDSGIKFLPNTDYVLAIALTLNSGVCIDNLSSVTVNGKTAEVLFATSDVGTGLIAIKLPKLTGETTQTKLSGLEFTLNGATADAPIANATLTTSDHAGVKKVSYTIWKDFSPHGKSTFTLGNIYTIDICVELNDGYYALGMTDADLTLTNASLTRYITVEECGSKVTYNFLLNIDTATSEHVHSYTEKFFGNGDKHYGVCSCGALSTEGVNHVYDEDKDLFTCTVCESRRTIEIKKINVTLENFNAHTAFNSIDLDYPDSVDVDCNFCTEVDISNNYVNIPVFWSDIIEPNVKYYLLLTFLPEDGYSVNSLTANNVTVNNNAAIGSINSYGYKYFVFELPVANTVHTHGGTFIAKAPASCTSEGVKGHYHCSVCGDDFDANDVKLTDLTIAKTAHTYGDWIAEVPASCTSEGTKGHYHCSVCGGDYDANDVKLTDLTIAKTAHTYGDWIAEVPANCTSEGTKGHYHCSVCGGDFDANDVKLTDLTIAKTTHTYGDWIAEVPANCTSEGVKGHYHCSVCGGDFDANDVKLTDLTIAKTAHTYGDWIAEVAPTTEEEGCIAHKDCSVCGKHFDESGNEIEDLTIAVLPKEGLSGGAIAGISVGSAAVVGVSGFSVFWFVIKKKSLADLLALFKIG